MYVYRLRYGLKDYFEDIHFDNMGKLLVFVCLVYLYFNLNEFLVPGYKMKLAEGIHLKELFSQELQLHVLVCADWRFGSSYPAVCSNSFRKPLPIAIISLVVMVSAWFKRYLIVIPTLEHPFLPVQNVPEHFQHYSPTSIEIMITLFSFLLH